jgi:hypothetical protein
MQLRAIRALRIERPQSILFAAKNVQPFRSFPLRDLLQICGRFDVGALDQGRLKPRSYRGALVFGEFFK